ncbi:RNA exonuclease 1 homolog, partial [Carlito syrichta]|uniref:RNA exonuclease 1 homolog n=1 Tax=Carlito syrichta TaxID=1868482 RepID=A0A3Q0DFR6_CARSF
LGYDPCNPELPKPPAQRENGALGLGDEPRSDAQELELVNQAIEAVRSEPSREGPEAEGGALPETKETAVQCDGGDLGPPTQDPSEAPPAKPGSPAQAAQNGGCPGDGKPKRKKSGTRAAPGRKDGAQRKDKGTDRAAVDYTALEKEVDFDSDPMEECLRIFHESTCVKTEDKGRLARQPLKEQQGEEKGPAGLTTLLPGQKRRISHLAKQGPEAEPPRSRPAAPLARPPTAQEVCYLRAQRAQRESAGGLQAEKPTSVHISAPGERKRIAHVPNPRLAAAPTGAKRTLAASSSQPSGGPEPSGQPLKTRTLAGMASKTTTTVTPKRVAHSPSLQ